KAADPVAKAFAMLDKIEASVTAEIDPIAKIDAALEKALAGHEPVDPLAKVQPQHLRELAQRLNVDPDAPDALGELRKQAGARPGFVDAWLAEPTPARTAGPGVSHMPAEQIAKLAPGASDIAK